MHSKSSLLQDVVVKVQVSTHPGETVCICGSSPELGQWQVSKAIILTKTCSEGDVWSGVIKAPVDRAIQYRYLVCIILGTEVEEDHITQNVRVREEHIVRRWESHLRPRVLSPSDIEDGKTSLSIFGIVDGIESIESGWLTTETIVQLKLLNNPVTIWKRRLRDKQLSIHVSTIDITRHDSEVHPFLEEDSTLTDGNQSNNWPVVELAVMNEENWQFTAQSQFGYVYEPGDYLTFQAQMIDPETIAYMVDFYLHESDIPEHVGFCYILPSNMRETSGTCNMPISGKKQQPIGQLTVEYLIVRPLKGWTCDLSISYARHWKTYKKGLDVGHRGAGNARRNDKVENVLENTVASFNYAARHGADMVELDVQLSKDLVPVIYHDYYICISMKKKRNPHEHELLQLAVKDLTAQQLQMLKLSPAKSHGSNHSHDFHEDDYEDNQPFPTLKHVLEAVDPRIGVNIEIKCPMQLHDGTWELDHRFELNTYVDIILRDILENAGDRYIILSCFDPDICTMVRLKQNKYPLLFLTQGQTDKYPPYLDTRTASIPMATYFALSAGLLGINVHAEDLLRDFSLINFVKEHKLVLFCWGEDINHSDVIRSFKEQGVDGVIYDKVDEFNTSQENVFLVEPKVRMGLLELAGSSSESLNAWSSTSTN